MFHSNSESLFSDLLLKTALFYTGSFIRIIISALLVCRLGKDSNKRLWTNKAGNTARNYAAGEHLLRQIWSYFDTGFFLRRILWHIVWLYWWFWRTINLSRCRWIACCLWHWFLVSSILLTQITNWFCYHSGTVLIDSSILIRNVSYIKRLFRGTLKGSWYPWMDQCYYKWLLDPRYNG